MTRLTANALAAALIGLILADSAWSFSNLSVGSTVDNLEMLTLEGDRHLLLGNAAVNVFLFFRPDQKHSTDLLARVGALEQELGGKSVRWAAVVSDRYSREEVQAVVQEVGLDLPVLFDEGDSLSAKLKVHVHPAVGITDQDHVLRVYLPFRKVNFINFLRAHVLHLLGELSEAELEKQLNPPRAEQGRASSVAKRNLKLAWRLYEGGHLQKALERARKSLHYDPDRAEAHALVGAILSMQGDCPGAVRAFERALRLDPDEPTALRGKKACQGG